MLVVHCAGILPGTLVGDFWDPLHLGKSLGNQLVAGVEGFLVVGSCLLVGGMVRIRMGLALIARVFGDRVCKCRRLGIGPRSGNDLPANDHAVKGLESIVGGAGGVVTPELNPHKGTIDAVGVRHIYAGNLPVFRSKLADVPKTFFQTLLVFEIVLGDEVVQVDGMHVFDPIVTDLRGFVHQHRCSDGVPAEHDSIEFVCSALGNHSLFAVRHLDGFATDDNVGDVTVFPTELPDIIETFLQAVTVF
mmetsp:Transcript_9171/g.27295  ORF Transcript_9171/g.27295 Transcript_9171/m.27295 type:complete len:247 (+) Transcript_9171:418-1158(+)